MIESRRITRVNGAHIPDPLGIPERIAGKARMHLTNKSGGLNVQRRKLYVLCLLFRLTSVCATALDFIASRVRRDNKRPSLPTSANPAGLSRDRGQLQ